MSNQEAIALLRNLEDSLDSYCELSEEGKTAFRMAIEALSSSEIPNSYDTISRAKAIEICDNAIDLLKGQFGAGALVAIKESIEELPPAQPELIEKAAYIRGFEQGRTQGMIDAQGGKK